MKFFCDNHVSPRLVRAVRDITQDDIVGLRERFDADIADIDYLIALGKEDGWVLVSADQRIMKRPLEREALQASGLSALFLPQQYVHWTLTDQASWVLKHWPEWKMCLEAANPGTIFCVRQNGKCKRQQL